MKIFTYLSVLILLIPKFVFASEIFLAVAANFAAPMEEIARAFTKETGHKLVISYGSTGKLYSQIKAHAPFEVFLSADQEHPKMLLAEQLAVAESQFTFAIGKLALWSSQSGIVDTKGEVLNANHFKYLAIANPGLAPYGRAAQEVLEKKKLWKNIEKKLVVGESISQCYQFVATGNAEIGFIALSQVKGSPLKGSIWVVPQELYSPLKQDAILLSKGKVNAAAKRFLEFLRGDKAKAIITDYGYDQ